MIGRKCLLNAPMKMGLFTIIYPWMSPGLNQVKIYRSLAPFLPNLAPFFAQSCTFFAQSRTFFKVKNKFPKLAPFFIDNFIAQFRNFFVQSPFN